MQGCMVYLPYRPRITERWFMAFQDSFEEIAKDPEMTGETYKVLMYLYSKLDFENFIQQSQMDVAEGLGIQKQRVSRAMKLLTSKQIVLEGPKVGRSKCYRLNPNYGWKGKVKTLQEARREQMRVIEGGKKIRSPPLKYCHPVLSGCILPDLRARPRGGNQTIPRGASLHSSFASSVLARYNDIRTTLFKEENMSGYFTDIEKKTLENNYFREVLFTGPFSQLVVMALQAGEEIGTETHDDVDQFIRVEAGQGKAILDGEEIELADGTAVVIPAGTEHNVVNISATEALKLYTIYTPAEHPDGTVHKTKAEADAAEHHH